MERNVLASGPTKIATVPSVFVSVHTTKIIENGGPVWEVGSPALR